MAANKFATILHNNTNKITLILIYAFLEWILITLLLLNSVFSYFIIKFARFFGLHPPCFPCSRIGRFHDHLCEQHSKEVSQLGFCLIHKKLAEFGDMCGKCSCSCSCSGRGFGKELGKIVFSKVERIDEVNLKCSCCGVDFDRNIVDEFDQIGSNYVEDYQEIERKEQSDEDENEEVETEETGVKVSKDLNLIEDDLIQFELAYANAGIVEHGNIFEDEDHEFGEFQKAEMNSQEILDSIDQKAEEASKFLEKTDISRGDSNDLIDFGDENVVMNEEVQDNDSVHKDEDEVSVVTQIPLLDSCDENIHEEPSTNSNNLHWNIENGEIAGDLKNLSIKIEESEEDKAPDTPSGIFSPNPFHKKWLIPKEKDIGTEESFDGSVISEADDGDPVSTAEKLKSALKAERKALRDLYLELEEERNASAVAANETMAMINRLQEEKAAMQMEALQYQRMMEEQSEYDHEALQLLNELMMKKEKELELYRKKVLDYEAKEKMRTASMSWSRFEDDEGSSVDLYHVREEENALVEDQEIQHAHTPVDSVLDMESTLADFEEERLSILEQLKILEEKLVALNDEEDQHFANGSVIEEHYEEVHYIGFSGQVTEYTTNRFVRNGKQPMGKQLLPLFEAISNEVEDDVTVRNGHENGYHPSKFEDTAVN